MDELGVGVGGEGGRAGLLAVVAVDEGETWAGEETPKKEDIRLRFAGGVAVAVDRMDAPSPSSCMSEATLPRGPFEAELPAVPVSEVDEGEAEADITAHTLLHSV